VYTGTDGVLHYSVSKIVGGFADPQQAPFQTHIWSGPICNFSGRALQSILSFSTDGTQYILLVTPSGKFSLFEIDVLTWRLNFIHWDDLGISDRGRVMDTKFTVRAKETSQRAFLATATSVRGAPSLESIFDAALFSMGLCRSARSLLMIPQQCCINHAYCVEDLKQLRPAFRY
jgi:hypothetical protein